jgi:hypothetical protein
VSYEDSGDTGESLSCVRGRVLDSVGRSIPGSVVRANNGSEGKPEAVTDRLGGYSICHLRASNWSVVLTFVPSQSSPSESSLAAEVVAVVYVNGSPEQVAEISFTEQ